MAVRSQMPRLPYLFVRHLRRPLPPCSKPRLNREPCPWATWTATDRLAAWFLVWLNVELAGGEDPRGRTGGLVHLQGGSSVFLSGL